MPLSIGTAIGYLETADAIGALEFFVIQGDNKGPELHCRIWPRGIARMPKKEVDGFCDALNSAIRSTTNVWRAKYTDKVKADPPK